MDESDGYRCWQVAYDHGSGDQPAAEATTYSRVARRPSRFSAKRVARFGNGWYSGIPATDETALRQSIAKLRQFCHECGRDPASVGIEGTVALRNNSLTDTSLENRVRLARVWKAVGATHINIGVDRSGLEGLDQHLDALLFFKRALS